VAVYLNEPVLTVAGTHHANIVAKEWPVAEHLGRPAQDVEQW
jgi:hypothetical protein